MLFGLQVALRLLPNIEVVSLLIVLFALHFRHRTLFMIYIFVLLEGLVYGFGIWWVSYLYVWTILYLAAILLKNLAPPASLGGIPWNLRAPFWFADLYSHLFDIGRRCRTFLYCQWALF